VLRRVLNLPDNSSSVSDAVIAAARTVDAKTLVVAICDERMRFLKSLKTWPVFGTGWGRRVADVKAVALAMAAGEPEPVTPKVQTQGRAVMPMAQGARRVSTGAIVAVGAAAAQQAHQSGMQPGALVVIVIGTALLATSMWLFWRWRQRRQQQARCEREIQLTIGGLQTMLDNFKIWFKNSVTILWARTVALAGLLLAVAQSLLTDPNMTGAVQVALQPKYIPYYVIAIGFITEIARRRTAGKVE
jgi:hypothetical protein